MVDVASVPIVSPTSRFSPIFERYRRAYSVETRTWFARPDADASRSTPPRDALGLLVTCPDGCTERCKPHILRPTLSLSNIGGRSWRVAR